MTNFAALAIEDFPQNLVGEANFVANIQMIKPNMVPANCKLISPKRFNLPFVLKLGAGVDEQHSDGFGKLKNLVTFNAFIWRTFKAQKNF